MHPNKALAAQQKSKLNRIQRHKSHWRAYLFQLMIGSSLLATPVFGQQAVRSGIDLAPFFENDKLVVIVKNSQGIEFPVDSDDIKKIFYKDAQTGLIQPINGNKLPNGYSQFAIDFIAQGPSASSGSAFIRGSGNGGQTPQMQVQFNPAQVPSSGTLVIDYGNLKSQFDKFGTNVINGNLNGQSIQFTLNPDGSITSSNGFIFYPDGRILDANGNNARFEVQYNNPGLASGDLSTSQKIQAILGSIYGPGAASGSFQYNGNFQGTSPAGGQGNFGFNGQIPQNPNQGAGTVWQGQIPGSNGGSIDFRAGQGQTPGSIQGNYNGTYRSNGNSQDYQPSLPNGNYQFSIQGSDIPSIVNQLHSQIGGFEFSTESAENNQLRLQAMSYFSNRLGYYQIDKSKIETPKYDKILKKDSDYSLQIKDNDYIHIVKVEVPGPNAGNDEWVMVRRVYQSNDPNDFILRIVSKEEHLAAIALADARGDKKFLQMAARHELATRQGDHYVGRYDDGDYKNAIAQAKWVNVEGNEAFLHSGSFSVGLGNIFGSNQGGQFVITNSSPAGAGQWGWNSQGSGAGQSPSGQWSYNGPAQNPNVSGGSWGFTPGTSSAPANAGSWGFSSAGNSGLPSGQAQWTFNDADQNQSGQGGAQFIIIGADGQPLANTNGQLVFNSNISAVGKLPFDISINGQKLDAASAQGLLGVYFASTGTSPADFDMNAFDAWLKANAIASQGPNGQLTISIRGASIDPQTGTLIFNGSAPANGTASFSTSQSSSPAPAAQIPVRRGHGYEIEALGDGRYQVLTFDLTTGPDGRIEENHKVEFKTEAELGDEYRDANGKLILKRDIFDGAKSAHTPSDNKASGENSQASSSDESSSNSGSIKIEDLPSERSTSQKIDEILASLTGHVSSMSAYWTDEEGFTRYTGDVLLDEPLPLKDVKNFLDSRGSSYRIDHVKENPVRN